MSTDIETRLRDALAARADLVVHEDLQPLAPVVELRPRLSRQSPWVLLATAAVVLLVLGIVLQGVGGQERSDRIAPQPDKAEVDLEIPADVGRDWKPGDLDKPKRLDLDGDGTREVVQFLAEKTKGFDGRFRLQTTLSSTGEEAYGIASLGTTVGINALEPIDADGDGDQELVLYYDDLDNGGYPLVYDLRDGLLVQAPPEDPELLTRGQEAVEGSKTDYYDMVHVHDYEVVDGVLRSSRSVAAYARGNMTLFQPRAYVADEWTWTLDEDGALRHGEAACVLRSYDSSRPCGATPTDTVASMPVERASYVGVGEEVQFGEGPVGFSARLEASADPSLVVDAPDGRRLDYGLEMPQPILGTVQPTSVFYDGASVVVTSEVDASLMRILVQDADRLVALDPVGEIDLTNDVGQRTWLTDMGSVLSAVANDNGTWELWQWMMVSRTEMAALPWGTVCIDDVDAPTSIIGC